MATAPRKHLIFRYDYYEVGKSNPNQVVNRDVKPHYRDCHFYDGPQMGTQTVPKPYNSISLGFSRKAELLNTYNSKCFTIGERFQAGLRLKTPMLLT